jgi:hypothetical protein
MNTTRANAADKIAKAAQDVATTATTAEPTQTVARVIARIGPGTRNTGQVVHAEIDGTILERAKDPEEVRRQARLTAIGDELESLIPAAERDRASRLMGESDALWAGRVNDVHDYVLREVGAALTDNGLVDLWRMLFAHLASDDDKYRPSAVMQFLNPPADCQDVGAFQERGGHW